LTVTDSTFILPRSSGDAIILNVSDERGIEVESREAAETGNAKNGQAKAVGGENE
jgi:hypothetical protein